MNEINNPYSPPIAAVEDFNDSETGHYLPGGRVVPAGNGSAWISSAWAMFKQSPGPWIGMFLLFMVTWMASCMVPLVNIIAIIVFPPIFMGGIMIACDNQRRTGALNVGDLFAGFQQKGGALALLGLLNMALVFVIFLPFVVLGIIGGVAAGLGGAFTGAYPGLVIVAVGLFVILISAVLCLAYAAMWFAPAIVALRNDISPFDAMKSSFKACMRNWRAGLIYFVLMMLLAILACIPLCLGFLVLAPLGYASIYTSYRDIFIQD